MVQVHFKLWGRSEIDAHSNTNSRVLISVSSKYSKKQMTFRGTSSTAAHGGAMLRRFQETKGFFFLLLFFFIACISSGFHDVFLLLKPERMTLISPNPLIRFFPLNCFITYRSTVNFVACLFRVKRRRTTALLTNWSHFCYSKRGPLLAEIRNDLFCFVFNGWD